MAYKLGCKTPLKKKGCKTPYKMKNPCWSGYEMYGTKNKNGKKVPNCVKK